MKIKLTVRGRSPTIDQIHALEPGGGFLYYNLRCGLLLAEVKLENELMGTVELPHTLITKGDEKGKLYSMYDAVRWSQIGFLEPIKGLAEEWLETEEADKAFVKMFQCRDYPDPTFKSKQQKMKDQLQNPSDTVKDAVIIEQNNKEPVNIFPI